MARLKNNNGPAVLTGARYFVLSLVALITVFPIWILFINSFKNNADISTSPFGLPQKLDFSFYAQTWISANYSSAMITTGIVCAGTVLIISITGSLAAYAITKLGMKGANFLSNYFLLLMSIPGMLYLVPLFIEFKKVNLVNNRFGMMLIFSVMFNGFSILLFRTFFLGIPKEFEEAAMIDGCSYMKIFTKVIIPLAKPIFLTIILVVWVWSWNEFMFSNTFLTSNELKMVSVKYYSFMSEFSTDLSSICAGGIMVILPIILLYVLLQKRFIEGMTSGGIKG